MSLVIDNSKLNLRFAIDNDCRLIWEWANDPVVRNNAFNSDPISWENHQSWYRKKIASPDTRLWILEYDSIPVAQIRYDRINFDIAEISYSVDVKYRGCGVGTKIIKLTTHLACEKLNVKNVKGLVLPSNKASMKVFVNAGFQNMGQTQVAKKFAYVFVGP